MQTGIFELDRWLADRETPKTHTQRRRVGHPEQALTWPT